MSYLRSFIPWIAFAALSTVGWQWGALAGLIIGVSLVMRDRRTGVAADALILEASAIAYFTVLTVVAFALPHSPLEHYDGALSFACLALTALATLAVRRPFTLGIARRSNTMITAAWATSFALTMVAVLAIDDSVFRLPFQRYGNVTSAWRRWGRHTDEASAKHIGGDRKSVRRLH